MQVILNSFMGIMIVLTLITVVLFIRAIIIQYQLDSLKERGYNINTLAHKRKMFWMIWVWDARKFATEDTFLERL